MNAGTSFEMEIREQPTVWRAIAGSDRVQRLADAIGSGEVLLLGSGSSLSIAQVGALALRQRGIHAHALAATEARYDHAAYRRALVVAISQSGESRDLLDALDVLLPTQLVALTNTVESPLGARANVVIDIGAGQETAVPASKSVSASVALLLFAVASIGAAACDPFLLRVAADVTETWLASDGVDRVREAAERIARRRSIVYVGSGFGAPIANELALKLREAAYLSADGFAAGEFQHGSSAMLDASFAMVGIVDDATREVVRRPLEAAEIAESARFVIGDEFDGITGLGPRVPEAWKTLAWLITGQLIALFAGRARGIDSDAPRGLVKAIR